MAIQSPPKVGQQSVYSDTKQLALRYLRWLEVADGKVRTTVNNRRYILQPFIVHLNTIGVYDIRQIRIAHIDLYIECNCAGQMPSSVNQVKQTIRHFLWYCTTHLNMELAIDYQLIRRHREPPRKPTIITFEKVHEVVRQVEEPQDGLMIALAFETGVRIGELVKITVEDIHDIEIRIRGKGSYDRIVFMSDELSRKIRRHLIAHHIYTGSIFRHLMHFEHLLDDTYSTCRARERIQAEFLKVGIKMVPHDLRHSFAILWLEHNGDLRSLQKLLGHSSLEVTQRYLQLSDRYIEEIYKKTITKSVYS